MKANNNPKNRKRFLEYQKRKLEQSRLTEEAARKRIISSNLDKWINSLPTHLKIAKPGSLNSATIDKIKKAPIRPPFTKNIVVSSKDISSSRFTSYSIIYELIKNGIVTPSQVKVTSLLDGYNNISGMFQSRSWKEYFFSDNSRVLLIEGSSNAITMLASRGEEQFWRELAEFTMNNDKLVIITYVTEEEERKKKVFIPSLTGDATLNARLIKESVFIPLTEIEEEEIKREQEESYRGL